MGRRNDGEASDGAECMEEGCGGGTGGSSGGRGGTREKTESKEDVWSGMFGFQSLRTSGRESGWSSSSARPRAPSHSAAHFLSSQSRPRPFVACEKRRTSSGRNCFDGWRK